MHMKILMDADTDKNKYVWTCRHATTSEKFTSQHMLFVIQILITNKSDFEYTTPHWILPCVLDYISFGKGGAAYIRGIPNIQ
jgi:hypothetical protein